MVCVYVPRISCYFATPQHSDRWKITQNSRGNASSIMVDFSIAMFFLGGMPHASSKILVGHLGNALSFCVVCLLPTQKQAKTTGKTTPWKSFGKTHCITKKNGKLYQFHHFLAVKQLTTGSQPKRSHCSFRSSSDFFFPKIVVVFWDFRNSFSYPSEFVASISASCISRCKRSSQMTWRGCNKWAMAAKFLRHCTDCPSGVTWKPAKTR